MARPQKIGMDYFPMDTNPNHKLDYLRMRFGLSGFGAVIRLWQRIYAEKGYYMDADEENLDFFAMENSIETDELMEIIEFAAKHGIFDFGLYKKEKILTSYDIQARYFSAASKRSRIDVESRYLLLSEEDCGANVCIDGVFAVQNPEEGAVTDVDNPQSKEKKSKENNNKININKNKENNIKENETAPKDRNEETKNVLRLADIYKRCTGSHPQNAVIEGLMDALCGGADPKRLENIILNAARRRETDELLISKFNKAEP